ncbi:MFS domain-containing protein [Fusarium sp. LHS14.1]|nr:MFS domain-containing protein [Fusarium sp. LHS14.1]
MGCAIGSKYGVLLLFRTLSGLAASAPNFVVGGLFADIYDNPTQRGRAMAIFIAIVLMGPPLGPLISGYTSGVSWRQCFWVGVAIAGAGLPLVILLAETYEGILNRKAGHGQNDTSGAFLTLPGKAEIRAIFSRPFIMLWKEPIVLFTSLYLALVYSILYLFFQAYPVIFGDIYSLSPRDIGLAFLPVSVDAVIAILIFFIFDLVWARAKAQNRPWTSNDKYARLPLACVGGPLVTIALF